MGKKNKSKKQTVVVQQPSPQVVVVREKPAKKKKKKGQSQALPHQQRIRAKVNRNMLAEFLALPGETQGVRLPTTDAPRTSVMVAKDQYTITVANVTPPPSWNNGDLVVAFHGQPGRLACIYTSLSTGNYQLAFNTGTSVNSTWILFQAVSGSYSPVMTWPLCGTTTQYFATTHGVTMAMGYSGSDNNQFVWMNSNDTITIFPASAWTSTAVGNVVFTIFAWGGRDTPTYEVGQTTITLASGNVPGASTVFTAIVPGYYQVVFDGIYITSGSVTSGSNGISLNLNCNATTGWKQISMNDLDPRIGGDISIGQACRVNAASMLMTNTTSVLNRQGTVLAARLKSEQFYQVTPAVLARAAEKYTGDAAQGVYTFKEFSSANENFVTATTPNPSALFDLDSDDYFHFIQITCPSVATSANTFTVSFDTCVEFKCDNARYSKAVSNISYEQLIAARRLINSTPEWFYENPEHMRAIYNFIRSGVQKLGRGLVTVAPYAARAASYAHPEGAAGYEMLAHLLRRGLTV